MSKMSGLTVRTSRSPLYLSRYIIDTKSDYYWLLLAVTAESAVSRQTRTRRARHRHVKRFGTFSSRQKNGSKICHIFVTWITLPLVHVELVKSRATGHLRGGCPQTPSRTHKLIALRKRPLQVVLTMTSEDSSPGTSLGASLRSDRGTARSHRISRFEKCGSTHRLFIVNERDSAINSGNH
jgi:hypothetical protein